MPTTIKTTSSTSTTATAQEKKKKKIFSITDHFQFNKQITSHMDNTQIQQRQQQQQQQQDDTDDDVFYSPGREIAQEKFEGVIDNENEEEKRKLGLIKAILHNQDPTNFKETDDPTLARFLRARNHNVDKAAEMFLKYASWRQTYVPGGSVSVAEIPNELAQNKFFMQGVDKNGYPIALVFGARHFPAKAGIEEFKRFLVFALDKLCTRIPDGQEKFTIIGDLKGYSYCNSDVRGYIAALSILQDYYPERLGRLLIVNAPYIFMTLWKMIYPFIDQNTKKKIMFVDNKRLRDILTEYIDESQLPETYGGKMKLVPIQEG